MAISATITRQAFGRPSKCLAENGGKHIYNILLEADTTNGMVIAKDAFVELDLYKSKASTGVAGVIRTQMANGEWLIEITAPGDGLFVYQVPMIEEEYNRNYTNEYNFYNLNGDIVRCYEMAVGDTFLLNEAAFDGTPVAGKALSIAAKKWKVATD